MHPAKKSKGSSSGLVAMILSCLFFAIMANLAYLAQKLEPQISTISMSGSRIFVNLVGVILLAVYTAKTNPQTAHLQNLLPPSSWWTQLKGNGEPSLWLRGVFGAIAMIFYFAALRSIGAGESTFLQSTNSLFIAALAPSFLGQKNTPLVWTALGGSALGLFLLLEPRITDSDPMGRLYGVGAGLFSAAAYLMIAKAGQRNRPESVVFYFCLVGSIMHLVLLFLFPARWPQQPLTWFLLLSIGFFGTIAQFFLTASYQRAPAALAGAVSYVQPVLNTFAGMFFFNHILDTGSWIGAGLIGSFGVVLPFLLHHQKTKSPSQEF